MPYKQGAKSKPKKEYKHDGSTILGTTTNCMRLASTLQNKNVRFHACVLIDDIYVSHHLAQSLLLHPTHAWIELAGVSTVSQKMSPVMSIRTVNDINFNITNDMHH